jgi:hypothetical protein
MNDSLIMDIEVEDDDGSVTPAQLRGCKCENDTFHVYRLKGLDHDHYTCTACGNTYCSLSFVPGQPAPKH